MTSMLLTKDEIGSLKPSQLKPYRNALKLVYDNPEFKDAYKQESNDTVLRMLSYIEIMREKSELIIGENCKSITKQFVNDNIKSVKKLSLLPEELQPSREYIETLTKISLSII